MLKVEPAPFWTSPIFAILGYFLVILCIFIKIAVRQRLGALNPPPIRSVHTSWHTLTKTVAPVYFKNSEHGHVTFKINIFQNGGVICRTKCGMMRYELFNTLSAITHGLPDYSSAITHGVDIFMSTPWADMCVAPMGGTILSHPRGFIDAVKALLTLGWDNIVNPLGFMDICKRLNLYLVLVVRGFLTFSKQISWHSLSLIVTLPTPVVWPCGLSSGNRNFCLF